MADEKALCYQELIEQRKQESEKIKRVAHEIVKLLSYNKLTIKQAEYTLEDAKNLLGDTMVVLKG